MSTPYFFFRPFLAPGRSWGALDWQSSAPDEVDGVAFAECFIAAAAAPLAGVLPMLLPIKADFMWQDDFLQVLHSQSVTFVLPEAALDDTALIEKCAQAAEHNPHHRRFALQLNDARWLRDVPRHVFSALIFDATVARQEIPAAELAHAHDQGFRLIATHVDSHEMFSWISEHGFSWCDGHFLVDPNPTFNKTPDLARLKLLKLLNMVRQDGDTKDIEAVFREEAKLSYNLLRLVNSVAVGARTKISNFSQAIAILGRRQLQRWLQLLIYANNLTEFPVPIPLMQLAAARGRQMELLSMAIDPMPRIPELSDNAFLVGLFSLLNILINLPTSEILKEIPLQDAAADALQNPADGGVLGRLLAAITTGEAGNFAQAAEILAGLGINPAVHAKSQITAYYWAGRINTNTGD